MSNIHSYNQISNQINRSVPEIVKSSIRNKLNSRRPIHGARVRSQLYKRKLADLVIDKRMIKVFPTLSRYTHDESIIFNFLDTAVRTYCRLQSFHPISKSEYREKIIDLTKSLSKAANIIDHLTRSDIELPGACDDSKYVFLQMMNDSQYKKTDSHIIKKNPYHPFYQYIKRDDIVTPDTVEFISAIIKTLESAADDPATYTWQKFLNGATPKVIGNDNFKKLVLVKTLSGFNFNNFNSPLDQVNASTISVLLNLPEDYTRNAVRYLRRQNN